MVLLKNVFSFGFFNIFASRHLSLFRAMGYESGILILSYFHNNPVSQRLSLEMYFVVASIVFSACSSS